MNKHLILIYTFLTILTAIFIFGKSSTTENSRGNLENRLTKVEFFQEATRVRDNVIGFKQVNASLISNAERSKSCNESTDLLIEWSEDIKNLGSDFTNYMGINQDAKNYFDSISKIYDNVIVDCNKLTNK